DAPRPARSSRAGFRCGRRTLRRDALSLGRQEQPRDRLFRPRAGVADLSRHRLPARQRHAAGWARPPARTERAPSAAARRPDLLEGPCRDRARWGEPRARQCTSHGDRVREHKGRDGADQGGRQRGHRDQAAL
ncbi:hypothetical protein KXV85_005007, partial [Aspergillus fumigatus]